MEEFRRALRRSARLVDVPGAPRTLRLDGTEGHGRGVRLSWSFIDPNVLPGEPTRHGRRVSGLLDVPSDDPGAAGPAWAAVQLAAAHEYKRQIDADWEPGEPYVPRTWTADEAWQALLSHLESDGDEVVAVDGEIRVRHGTERVVYRIDPAEWAEHLTEPAAAWDPDSDVVPVGTPMIGGLPLWAVDELDEARGSGGPVVRLVDGRIVGSR